MEKEIESLCWIVIIFPRTLRMTYQGRSVGEGYAYLYSYPEILVYRTEVQVRKVREPR